LCTTDLIISTQGCSYPGLHVELSWVSSFFKGVLYSTGLIISTQGCSRWELAASERDDSATIERPTIKKKK